MVELIFISHSCNNSMKEFMLNAKRSIEKIECESLRSEAKNGNHNS